MGILGGIGQERQTAFTCIHAVPVDTSRSVLSRARNLGRVMRPRGLALDESQQVRIDHIGMHGHQAVGKAGVNLERAILKQLHLQQ